MISRTAAPLVFRRSDWPFEDGTGQFRTAFIVIVSYWTAPTPLTHDQGIQKNVAVGGNA
jgi:hypothetical protein